MIARTSHRLPPAPPPSIMEELRRRLSGQEMQALETVFALRTTAQQVDNAVTGWMADTAGSPARYQILMLQKSARGSGVSHKEIAAAMGVTRATVSGLMTALEREGFVRSATDRDDRRKVLATLTARGETVIGKAHDANRNRLRAALADLSPAELTTLAALLNRVRDGFAANAGAGSR